MKKQKYPTLLLRIKKTGREVSKHGIKLDYKNRVCKTSEQKAGNSLNINSK
jgi:hypothetical protein